MVVVVVFNLLKKRAVPLRFHPFGCNPSQRGSMSKTRPEIILEFLKKDPKLWQGVYAHYIAGLEARIEELEGLDRLDEVLVNAGIEQLEAEPRWISVKDRLPEDFVSVLAWDYDGDSCWVSTEWMEDGEWAMWGGPEHEVLFWMPIPPMPEEIRSLIFQKIRAKYGAAEKQ